MGSAHAARQHHEHVGAIVARLFDQTTDLEMEFIKLEVFGVDGGAPIMAKEHSALQELFKLNAGEQLCPVLVKRLSVLPLLYADEKLLFQTLLFEMSSRMG